MDEAIKHAMGKGAACFAAPGAAGNATEGRTTSLLAQAASEDLSVAPPPAKKGKKDPPAPKKVTSITDMLLASP